MRNVVSYLSHARRNTIFRPVFKPPASQLLRLLLSDNVTFGRQIGERRSHQGPPLKGGIFASRSSSGF